MKRAVLTIGRRVEVKTSKSDRHGQMARSHNHGRDYLCEISHRRSARHFNFATLRVYISKKSQAFSE
jgi:hypothetical protein